MKRISPDFSSDITPISPSHKLISVSSSSPPSKSIDTFESNFLKLSSPPLLRKEVNMDDSGNEITDKAIILPQIPSTSNLIPGKPFVTFIDNSNFTVTSFTPDTPMHNYISDQTDKTLLTKEMLEKYTKSNAEDNVFKRSRVDSKRYQAEVSDIPIGSNADLNKRAEEVKTHCQFEAKDSSRLELINSFLQFAQRLNNEWAGAGGSGP